MALGFNALTSGTNGGTASGGFSTASISPTGLALVLIAVHASDGSDPGTISIAGFGVTWTQHGSNGRYDAAGTDGSVYLAWALMPASPGSDTIDVTFSNSTVTNQAWSVWQFTGVDQTTPVAQEGAHTDTNPVTARSVDMGTRAGNNATAYVWGFDDTSTGFTNDSSFTQIHTVLQERRMYTMYDLGGDQAIDVSSSPTSIRQALLTVEVAEAASSDRRGRVSWAELEVPNAPRRGRVSWAELELPSAPRTARVSWAEMEVPTAPREAQVSWAEFEVPNAPRLGRVSWAELEIPSPPRTAQISWAEFEIPDGARSARVSWAEIEIPTAPREAQVSWAELEIPNPPTADRIGQVSWAELEIPTAPRLAVISWAEMELPTAPRLVRVSWAEFEIPDAPITDRIALISWAEFEIPTAPGGARLLTLTLLRVG